MPNTPELEKLAKEHSKKMRVFADDGRAKCVDGGYKEDEAVGAMAIPGGHEGVSMALLSLGFSAQESFDIVHNFLKKRNIPYCWHTDTHEGSDGCIVGCGHWNTAISCCDEYCVDKKEVLKLLEIIKVASEVKSSEVECVVLDRDHKEKGILVVESTDYTVKPWDVKEDIQFFIYDKNRHQMFLRELCDENNIDFSKLKEATDKQTNLTLGLLGSSRGKPMYSVDVSSVEPEVSFIADAPVIELSTE